MKCKEFCNICIKTGQLLSFCLSLQDVTIGTDTIFGCSYNMMFLVAHSIPVRLEVPYTVLCKELRRAKYATQHHIVFPNGRNPFIQFNPVSNKRM